MRNKGGRPIAFPEPQLAAFRLSDFSIKLKEADLGRGRIFASCKQAFVHLRNACGHRESGTKPPVLDT